MGSIPKWIIGGTAALAGFILPPLLFPTLNKAGLTIHDMIVSHDFRTSLSRREVKAICQGIFGRPEAHGSICFSDYQIRNDYQRDPESAARKYQTKGSHITIVSNRFVTTKCYGYRTDTALYHPCLKFLAHNTEAYSNIVVADFDAENWSPLIQVEEAQTAASFIAISGHVTDYDTNLNIIRITDTALENPQPLAPFNIAKAIEDTYTQ